MYKYALAYIFSLLFFVVTLSGCSSLYMPNVPNTPMLSAQNELSASGHISLKGNVSLNSAYAVTNHFGMLLDGEYINRNQHKKDFRQSMVEIGGGYFDTFGIDNNRIFEVYAGIGTGKSERIFNNVDANGLPVYDRQEMNFNKTFIQFNYSSKKERSLMMFGKEFPLNYGTAIRISNMNMKSFKINDVSQFRENNVFVEPVFFTRIHLNDAVQLQYTTGSNFGLKNRKYLTAGNSVFSLGVSINLGGKGNKPALIEENP